MFLIKLSFVCFKNIILYSGEDGICQSCFEFVSSMEKKLPRYILYSKISFFVLPFLVAEMAEYV